MTVKLEHDESGPVALVSGLWSPGDAEAIRRSGVRRLRIVVRSNDLAFLQELDGIEEVRIVDHTIKSDGGVAALAGLRVLSLQTYSQDRIDFAVFKQLERLAFNWRPGCETAFETDTLKSLAVSGYPASDLKPLAALSRLEALRISNSRRLRTLDGVAELEALKILSLRDDQQLADISALASMDHSLEELEFEVCRKVTDISAIGRHHALRRLSLDDCGRIPSLAPVANLAELEEFYFYGTTRIEDGDMTPLLRMPALRRVAFARRVRHNSHGVADIERIRHLKESPPLPHWRW